jgi:hypothetical protein
MTHTDKVKRKPHRSLALLSVAAIMTAGCRENQPGLPLTPPGVATELNAALTPSVRAALRPDGTFNTTVADQAAGSQITEAQATQLATAFGKAYAVHSRTYLEAEHKARIDFGKLAPCGRAMYASSPYRAAAEAPTYVRNVVAPRWFITLCVDGVPSLSVAVAALATELRVETNRNRIVFPSPHGNEFLAQGIPPEWQGALAISPEQAAILAHGVTGHHVDQVPRLTIVDPDWIPQAAQWVIHLDGPVQAAQAAVTRRVFVGLRLDGLPALGNDAVAVQVQRAPIASSASVIGPPNDHLSQVTQSPEFGFGWKTLFTPIRRERAGQ